MSAVTHGTHPGVRPLLLERTHNSGFRLSGWFGRTWSSTLDQRLEIDDAGVIFVAADGVRLFYPHPGVDAEVLPTEGARWPLHGTTDGGYLTSQPATGHTLHFPRPFGAGRWPLGELTDRASNRIAFHHDSAGTPTEIVHDGGYRVRISTDDGRITGLALLACPRLPG